MNNRENALRIRFLILVSIFAGMVFLLWSTKPETKKESVVTENVENLPIGAVTITPMVATISATPTATPTAKALSFSELNNLYGPCTKLPVITYHHVKDKQAAIKAGHGSLTVDTAWFRKQIEYFKAHNYNFISASDLANFFNNGTSLPSKPILLTFDDGYDDNYTDAFPIMKEYGAKGLIFIPTGLMNNVGYLTWNNIMEMNGSGLITFGNHTWSHINVGAKKEVVDKEISTADIQLSEKGLNGVKTFAYPYGLQNVSTQELLANKGYEMAFTTKSGTIMCKKQKMILPRIRVGDAMPSAYGL